MWRLCDTDGNRLSFQRRLWKGNDDDDCFIVKKMVLSDEGDQDVERRFKELCADLNMDKNAAVEAWQAYEKIGQNYTLEGEALHWLACALYVSCRNSTVPMVGKSGAMIEGNCVSLTRLLRSCKLSLLQFFTKMKKWSDMASLPQDFRNKVDQLERNFAVSTVIFKKFEPIFLATFKEPCEETLRTKSRKQKHKPCSSADLFSFCWTLFVQVKGNFPAISDDLVNSYHLLLCCIDLLYNNVLLADRRDLLNPTFSGLPDNFGGRDYKPAAEPMCIIQLLCDKHDGLVVEAKGIKEHWWKPYVKKLFDRKSLKGKVETLSGLIDVGNYDTNSKAINNAYETFVLNVGDFDERIFLGEAASAEIGTLSNSALASAGDLVERMQVKRNLQQHLETTKTLAPHTPLTGRRYLTGKEIFNVTPVSTATQSVSKLQTLLSGRKTSPNEALQEIFKECSKDPTDVITNLIKSMGETFCTFYAQPSDDHQGSHVDFAKKRLQLGESLFYKTLESIMLKEKKRLPAKFDFTALLDNEMFHRSLFACCLEIVIFSYNSQRAFPWIIEIFNIEPYDFYKVIEVLIRAEDGLSRDVVKHLNHIEEQILESLAWKSDSPLWDAIKESGKPLPSCEDVSLPNQVEGSGNQLQANSNLLGSPVLHPTITRLATLDRSLTKNLQQSPVAASLAERFQSPGSNGTVSSAKRRLFATTVPLTFTRPVTVTTTSPSGKTQNETVLLQTNGGTSTVLSPAKTVAFAVQPQGEGGCITYIPTQIVTLSTATSLGSNSLLVSATTANSEKSKPVPPAKPKRTGSLSLFFRKFYNVAGVRVRDLCDKLEIMDEDLRKKIWTCFEHSIINNTDLMMDRHLDQMLMCATYVMAKVTGPDKRFQEIMKCYRLQPQAASHVYRSVLLCTKKRRNSGSSEGSKNEASESNSPVPMEKDEDKDKVADEKRKLRLAIRSSSTLPVDHHSNSQPPTPTRLAGTSSSFEFEDRGDLITFYNTVYIQRMQKFVVKFSTTNKNKGAESPPLSPLPVPKSYNMSPRRRVSTNHSLFISPLKCSPSPSRPLSYSFNRSPAKDLRAINNMVRLGGECKIGKRILQDDGDSDNPSKRACLDLTIRRIQSVITERKGARGCGTE